MKNFILAAIVLAFLLTHPAYALDNLTIGDMNEKFEIYAYNDMFAGTTMVKENRNELLQEVRDRKALIDMVQSKVQALLDLKKQPLKKSISDTQKKGRTLGSADEKSYSESQEQYEGLYQNWSSTYDQKVKDRVLNILSEIPLQGKLTPAEAGLETTMVILKEKNDPYIHLIELEGVNNKLLAMKKESVDFEERVMDTYIKSAPAFPTLAAIVSFMGIYFLVKRNKRR